MSFLALLFLTISCTSVLVASDQWDCANYYWRDYRGKIPYDAIPADYNNNRYIGSVYIKDYELLVATIFPIEGYAQTTAYTHILNATENIKILCGPDRRTFEWIHIHTKDIDQYEPRNLIPGGSEVGNTLLIGKTYVNGFPTIGKIFRHDKTQLGMAYTDGKKIINILEYDILSYNCNKGVFPYINPID